MRIDTIYEVCAPDVVAEDFGGEIVVLNLANGKYFSLLGVSADIWRDLAQGYRPRDIFGHAKEAGPEVEAAVNALIADMIREGLIRSVPDNADGSTPSAQSASTAVSLAACTGVPGLEAFDDMAELILADPIHDVEEDMGWPVKRDPVPSA